MLVSRSGSRPVPEISRFFGIVIQMFPNDHLPPHFHAGYGGSHVRVGIDPVVLLDGRLPPRVLAIIVEWASLHRDELLANWGRLRRGLPPEPIAPLE
jgi:hypothetical protein